MAIPDFQSLMLPLLRFAGDGNEHTLREAVDHLAHEFQLSDEDRKELLPSGRQARFDNRTGWASTYLRKALLLEGLGGGRFKLTVRGSEVLAGNPARIDLRFLETRFPEIVEFRNRIPGGVAEGEAPSFNAADGSWMQRPEVEQRIREKVEHFVPDKETRRAVLNFFAFALETADEERDDAWYSWDSPHRVRLMTGRLLACELTRSRLCVGVVGPISDDVRAALGAEDEADDDAFTTIPGASFCDFRWSMPARRLTGCAKASPASSNWRWRACAMRPTWSVTFRRLSRTLRRS